jgi:hypothetical protein
MILPPISHIISIRSLTSFKLPDAIHAHCYPLKCHRRDNRRSSAHQRPIRHETGYFAEEGDEPSSWHFASIASMVLEGAGMTRAMIMRMIQMPNSISHETGAHETESLHTRRTLRRMGPPATELTVMRRYNSDILAWLPD